MKKRELVDVKEPNLLEDQFDYSLPPRILFEGPILEEIDGKVVRFDPREAVARDLVITDTTFRDGQQARPPYTVEQQVAIYDMMAKLGGPNGVIRQTEFFLYTKNDREALNRFLDPRGQGRFSAGQGGGRQGDRHAHLVLGLSHLHEAQEDAQAGV